MWPRANQMSKTFLFHTHISELRRISPNIQNSFCAICFEVEHFSSWWDETFLGEFSIFALEYFSYTVFN